MTVSSSRVERIEVEPGVRLAVEAAPPSSKPVVMLSNSIGASMTMWDEFVERMSDKVRIVRYDTRGHGQSDVPKGPYSIDQLGQDAEAILAALDIQSAVFCGLSLGGLTGMWLGAARSKRVAGLILANTAANFPPATMWQERAAAVRTNGMQSLVGATLDRWFTKSYHTSHPDRLAELGRMVGATPAEGYAGCCEVLAAADLKPRLANVACPVRVICGQHDPSTPPARGEEIVASIAGSDMVVLDAAHISSVEAPDAFAEAVTQFLSRALSAAT